MIDFTVGVYQVKGDGEERWTALVPVRHHAYITGQGEVRLRERMIDRLRDVLRRATPRDQELFQLPLGTELVRMPIDLKLEKGRVHGVLPLIVEPRWTGDEHQRLFVYHPLRRSDWFVAEDRNDVAQLAPVYFRQAWKELDEETSEWLMSNGKDRLTQLAFSAEPQSLLDLLPSRKKDNRAAASAPRPENVLQQVGVDETQRVSAGTLVTGVPRSPYASGSRICSAAHARARSP